MADEPTPTAQVDRSSCNYRWLGMAQPNRCEYCEYFHPGVRNMNSCDNVFGLVHPMFGCDLFERKEEGGHP